MNHPTIAALLPMRHSSERVPGKNYRPFAGAPLYHHVVRALRGCPAISHIVIDTDSPVIWDDCQRHFPEVLLLERPLHLRAGTTPMNDVLLHDVAQVTADFYLQTHSTNPLLRSDTITEAIDQFLTLYPVYDSLFSVTRLQTRLWDSLARPINHNAAILLRTQDLPPVYEENSCMFIFTKHTLQQRHNRIGERPLLFEISAREAQDIDEELDFQIAEFLFLARQGKQQGF